MDPDAAIRSTDSDAAQARLSAVKKGYLLDDPFIAFFVPRARFVPPRPPLINVGTFVRATAVDTLVLRWIRTFPQVQIVSLGAGSDTRFWRLSASGYLPRISHYVELDFPENTGRKVDIIRKVAALSNHVTGEVRVEKGGTAMHSERYTLLPVDLRNPPSEFLQPLIANSTLQSSIPTLFISECVFAYMPRDSSDRLVRWFSETFEVAGGLLYEMFGLTDNFGDIMRSNLMSRGVALPGVDAYPTLESQKARFTRQKFSIATAKTLRTVRRTYITRTELARIATLEMLDEIEELDLVLDHYVIAWGMKPPADSHQISWGLDAEDSDEQIEQIGPCS